MQLTINADSLQQAILRAPDRLEVHLKKAITRSVMEMARSAREYAPKAFSTLVNSIRSRTLSALEGQVAPGVDYAEAVERGTGIYGPRGMASGKLPPVQNIEDWIKVAGIEPRNPKMSKHDLAWVFARHIATHGTKPKPYMQPAYDNNLQRTEQRINAAIDKTIAEAGG